jgi:hypothetical protein
VRTLFCFNVFTLLTYGSDTQATPFTWTSSCFRRLTRSTLMKSLSRLRREAQLAVVR